MHSDINELQNPYVYYRGLYLISSLARQLVYGG